MEECVCPLYPPSGQESPRAGLVALTSAGDDAAVIDTGDHLHLSDAGYKAMADAVDLRLFGGKR